MASRQLLVACAGLSLRAAPAASAAVGSAGAAAASRAARGAAGARREGEFSRARFLSTRTYFSKEESKSVYKHGKHRSDAEQLIDEYPLVECSTPVAVCDGGGGALGHPLEYITVYDGTEVVPTPQVCKYCGLRYIYKPKAGGH